MLKILRAKNTFNFHLQTFLATMWKSNSCFQLQNIFHSLYPGHIWKLPKQSDYTSIGCTFRSIVCFRPQLVDMGRSYSIYKSDSDGNYFTKITNSTITCWFLSGVRRLKTLAGGWIGSVYIDYNSESKVWKSKSMMTYISGKTWALLNVTGIHEGSNDERSSLHIISMHQTTQD